MSLAILVMLGFFENFLEECFKAFLAYFCRGKFLSIIAVIAFPVLSSYIYYDEIHNHVIYLSSSDTFLQVFLTCIFLIGLGLAHVFTSILYIKTRFSVNLALSIAFSSIVMYLKRYFSSTLPPFELTAYMLLPWMISALVGLILLGFYLFISKAFKW